MGDDSGRPGGLSSHELQLGDGVLMKAFKWHTSDGFAILSFGGPKPKNAYHLFMWLGVYADDSAIASDATADDRLNALGWVFDPKRAAQAIEARESLDVCTCGEVCGEDPDCAQHGRNTEWGVKNAAIDGSRALASQESDHG